MDIEDLADIPTEIECDLGRTNLTLKELLSLEKGSLIILNKEAGENAEVYLNKRIIGRGEVLVFEKYLAVRLNHIPSSDTIIKYLKEEKRIF